MKTLADTIQKQIGMINAAGKMMQSQQWQNQFNRLKMSNAALKSIGQRQLYYSKYFSALEKFENTISLKTKFNIPAGAINNIQSINDQHKQLFASLSYLFKDSSSFNQLNNLQNVLQGISIQFNSYAAAHKKWDLLQDFEEITNGAIAINENIINDEGFTNERVNEIKNFLERIELKIDKVDSDANAIFWKFLIILGFIFSILGEIRSWTPKPNFATKKEVEAIIKTQFSAFESKLKAKKEFRTTYRRCNVFLKPNTKAPIVANIPKNFDLIVLKIHHKWIYVSFSSQKDSLPQKGWVMKKYLSKQK